MEKYRIGDLVYNMANIIDVTLPGQHQDLYGQAISYNILANHLLSCRPCNHGHGTLREAFNKKNIFLLTFVNKRGGVWRELRQ